MWTSTSLRRPSRSSRKAPLTLLQSRKHRHQSPSSHGRQHPSLQSHISRRPNFWTIQKFWYTNNFCNSNTFWNSSNNSNSFNSCFSVNSWCRSRTLRSLFIFKTRVYWGRPLLLSSSTTWRRRTSYRIWQSHKQSSWRGCWWSIQTYRPRIRLD